MAFIFEDEQQQPEQQFVFEDEQKPTPQPVPQASPLQQAARTVAPYARPALELGGALLGGVAALPGTAVMGPAAPIIGGGLGYAAGRRVARGLETMGGLKPPETLPQALAETALDIPTGAAIEAGGGILGAPIAAGAKALGRFAPKLYESALTGIPKTLPKPRKTRAIRTALEQEIAPTQKGMIKLMDRIDQAGEAIGQTVGRMAKEGDVIKTENILKSLDRMKSAAKNTAFPDDAIKKIDALKKKFVAQHGEEMTALDAWKMQKEIRSEIAKAAYKVDPRLSTAGEFQKNVAEGAVKQLVDMYPELQSKNVKFSDLKALEDVIERTAERMQKAGLGVSDIGTGLAAASTMGRGAGTPAAIISKVLQIPAVKANIAFILNKIGKRQGGRVLPRTVAYGATKAAENPEERQKAVEKLVPIIEGMNPATEAEAVEAIPTALDIRNKGILAYQDGNYDEAVANFKQALAMDPANSGIYRRAIDDTIAMKRAVMARTGGKKNATN